MWAQCLHEYELNENTLMYQAAQEYGCSTEPRLPG